MGVSGSTYFRALARFTAALAGVRSIERMGELTCATALKMLGADGACVLLSDGRGRYSPYYSSHDRNMLRPGMPACELGALERSASGWAVCMNRPLIVPHVASDSRTPASYYGPLLIESLISVPIGGTEQAAPLGAIECHWIETHVGSNEELQQLLLVAEVTALALRTFHLRSQLASQARARSADLEAFSQHLLREVCERRRTAEDLHKLALTDELTGLYNRRGLFTLGEPMLQEGRSRGCPVYVLYADMDNLKAVNDTQGHEAGDRLIQAAARELRGALRSGDLLARIGGDEFCAILPGGNGDGSVLLERLGRLGSADPSCGAPALSFGLVRDDPPLTNLQGLIQRADQVMYVLKRWRKEHTFAAVST